MILKMKAFKKEQIIITSIQRRMKILILNCYSKDKTNPNFNNDQFHDYLIFNNSYNLISIYF